MSDDIPSLITRYRTRGLLVDTNLLLLYLIGSLDATLIGRFKRTATFVIEDFRLLQRFIAEFERPFTTPNVLAEVNSLANQLPQQDRRRFLVVFARAFEVLQEVHVPAAEAAKQPRFARFGLTDSTIAAVAERGVLVLTDDFALSQSLRARGLDAINFNHLRPLGWR